MLCKPKVNMQHKQSATIRIGGIALENINSYNYLGVVDDELNFNDFLKNKYLWINQCLYHLAIMRKHIDCHIACTIYKQTVISLFDYRDFLKDSGAIYYIDNLGNLQ